MFKNYQLIIYLTLLFLIQINSQFFLEDYCLPECSWKLTNYGCPAWPIWVCNEPKCETICEEVKNITCVNLCEPITTIKCPPPLIIPNNVINITLIPPKCEIINTTNCITQCEAPTPKCNVKCEEPKCYIICTKRITCPEPQYELECKYPQCIPKDNECCYCETWNDLITDNSIIFNESNENKKCCKCNKVIINK